jgi:hypothetical protein
MEHHILTKNMQNFGINITFMVEDTVDNEDSSDSLDSEPPGDKLRFLRFLRGRPFKFGAEIQKKINNKCAHSVR